MKRILFLFFSMFFLLEHSYAEPSVDIARVQSSNSVQVLRFIKPFLPPNPVIVEAGACDGSDTVKMAIFWPRGHIYSFEPVPELFQRIKKRTQPLRNVTVYPIALSDHNGWAKFYVSVSAHDDQIAGSSSLLPPKEHLKAYPDVLFPRIIDVGAMTLDKWAGEAGVNHIDFMWLDMQGYELNMLNESELAKKARAIWLECEFIEAYEGQYLFNDIQQWMEENGFNLIATDFDIQNPEGYYGNAMFIKK